MGSIASAATLLAQLLAAQPGPMTAPERHDIIVTARRRDEAAQRVPITLSVVDGKAIEAGDLRNSTDLSGRVPNLLAPANSVAIAAPTYFIRGTGQGGRNWNVENGVAVFVDDVYLQATAGAWLDFTDMERVEVLRGPQGTLYGRNSTIGAIKYVPRRADPSGLSGYADVNLGQGGRVEFRTGANLPIAKGQGAIRFNLFDIRANGNLIAVDASNQPVDGRLARIRHSGARLSTLWRPRDELELELNGDISHQDDGMHIVTAIVPDDPAGVTDRQLLFSRHGTVRFVPLYGIGRASLEPLTVGGGSELTGGGLVFKARLDTAIGRVSSISAWRRYRQQFVSQLGGRSTPSTLLGVTRYGHVNTIYENVSQVSQELQLSGQWRSLVDYTAGVYFFHNRWRESEYGATNGVPANLSPFLIPGQSQPFGGSFNDIDQTTNSYALYASADWRITPRLTISAGARETWDDKRLFFETLFEDHEHVYPGFPINSKKRWSRFTPRFGADWKPHPALMVYASWAKGYKVGNVEGARSSNATTAGRWLEPELSTTWEAGVKAEGLRGRLRANLAAFTSLSTGRTDPVNPDRVASSTVRSKGIEGEVWFRPTADLRLHAAAGWLWAKYRELSANHPARVPDFNGFAPGFDATPPMSPRYTLSADANYRVNLGSRGALIANASVVTVARHFHVLGLNNYDSEVVEPYVVVDASVGWASAHSRVNLTIGAHNLLDTVYWTNGMFGTIPEFAGRYYAEPMRLYAELRFNL